MSGRSCFERGGQETQPWLIWQNSPTAPILGHSTVCSKFHGPPPPSLADPASTIFYKIYAFGDPVPTDDVTPDGSVSVTPWVTATTTFETASISRNGLYSVWVRAAHKDYTAGNADTGTLFTDANSGTATSYAIGAL